MSGCLRRSGALQEVIIEGGTKAWHPLQGLPRRVGEALSLASDQIKCCRGAEAQLSVGQGFPSCPSGHFIILSKQPFGVLPQFLRSLLCKKGIAIGEFPKWGQKGQTQ